MAGVATPWEEMLEEQLGDMLAAASAEQVGWVGLWCRWRVGEGPVKGRVRACAGRRAARKLAQQPC
jgi:hypothetical protein